MRHVVVRNCICKWYVIETTKDILRRGRFLRILAELFHDELVEL